MRTKWLLLAILLVCCALTGCGVPLQDQPEGFSLPSEAAPPAGPPQGDLTATVFLVGESGLVPVDRATSESSLPAVLSLLVEGPTPAEAASGLRSALAVGSVDPSTLEEGPEVRGRLVEVAVTESFTKTTGEDQLLATAQLVWTVTEDSSVTLVRLVVGGDPIPLPTDTGLSDDPVSRADYRTVAPPAG